MIQNQDLIELVILLRFGPSNFRDINRPLLSISAISKALKIPSSTISNLLKKGITYMKSKKLVTAQGKSKFKERHFEYLLHPDTLMTWAHLSLK
jgi:hypothetical protein